MGVAQPEPHAVPNVGIGCRKIFRGDCRADSGTLASERPVLKQNGTGQTLHYNARASSCSYRSKATVAQP